MKKIQYTWNAEDYAKHSSAQQQWAKELIPKLSLQGHESVLDIGCGDGKITAEIANCVPNGHVMGVDSSNEMIRLSNANFPRKKYSNLSFQICDARNLPFEDRFDVVFSTAALHWVKNHNPVLKSIKKSLKVNGRILLQMGGKGNVEAMISVLDTMLFEKEWNDYFSGFEFPYGFYDVEEYQALLEGAGLTPLRVELIPKVMSYNSKAGLAGWVRTTWLPYTQRLSEDKRDIFINQLVDGYIGTHPLDNEGRVHVNMMRLEVEAIKSI